MQSVKIRVLAEREAPRRQHRMGPLLHEGHRPAHDSWHPRGTPASLSVVISSGRSKCRRPKAPLETP
eukprot:622187-Prymnesium_polylepis.2